MVTSENMHVRFMFALVAALLVTVTVASTAMATTTVSMTSGIVLVEADTGIDNDILAVPYGSNHKVYEYNDSITAGSGCTQTGTNQVRCNGALAFEFDTKDGDDFINSYYVALNQTIIAGSGNDTIESGGYSNHSDTVIAGDGDDTITADAGDDSLYGQDGNDLIDGGDGDDTIEGGDEAFGAATPDTLLGGDGDDDIDSGSGDSVMDGGAGSDTLTGGSNWNIVTYESRTASVTADADGVADDGESGENDDIATNVDQIDGGSGNDTLTASATAAYGHLYGHGGDDTLNGNNQTLFGDTLDGGAGEDTINGNAGSDFILADDGEDDSIDCGAGSADTVYADASPLDATVTACETVNR